MRCDICGTEETVGNPVHRDKKTDQNICAVCDEVIISTILEFDTEKCSEEYKRDHGII